MNAHEPSSAVTPALAIATVGVLVGLADLPYGYYMLLRLGLCGGSLFLLLGANLVLQDWHRWALGSFAVLYNPVLPVRLGEKVIWVILNIATVVLFWVIRGSQGRRDRPASSASFAKSGVEANDHGKPDGQQALGSDHKDIRRQASFAREAERERLAQETERLRRWQQKVHRK